MADPKLRRQAKEIRQQREEIERLRGRIVRAYHAISDVRETRRLGRSAKMELANACYELRQAVGDDALVRSP